MLKQQIKVSQHVAVPLFSPFCVENSDWISFGELHPKLRLQCM